MNEEIDENECYQDFTTASDWEIFIARIEEVLNQWKKEDLGGEAPPNNSAWNIRTEAINFDKFEFQLSFHRKRSHGESKVRNPMEQMYDFQRDKKENREFEHYSISDFYGLEEFIVLAPLREVISTECRIKLLLSSICIAASNVRAEQAIFVQIHDKWQHCYLGVFEGDGVRTNFEMVHLREGPSSCQHLNGILDLFKMKMNSPDGQENVQVSVRFTYSLFDSAWVQQQAGNSLNKLPFGVQVNPIRKLYLKTTWNYLPEYLVDDMTLELCRAHSWSLLVNFVEEPVCLLSNLLQEVGQIYNEGRNGSSVYDVLGTMLSRVGRNSLGKNVRDGIERPIPEGSLADVLYFLFPDADSSNPRVYGLKEESTNLLDLDFRGLKTCPQDSLTWRLSIVLVNSFLKLGGLKALSHVWYEFVQEMRYRWDKSMTLPGLGDGHPDLGSCLLNQKLQMLNSCILKKIEREQSKEHEKLLFLQEFDSSSTDEEEFFDAEEERTKHSLWNQPVGRLGVFNNLKLLESEDFLYIPITQDAVIKTEDELEEDAEFLMKLGSDAEASELRARILSASLLSDMESFKAANPGSILEDFIRWYSPKDWVEDPEDTKGKLSDRMRIEDNIWMETWQAAKPVPASRQQCLFNYSCQAEKTIHFLDTRNISQVIELILPVLMHAAIERLVGEADPSSQELLNSLVKLAEKITRNKHFQSSFLEQFQRELASVELLLVQKMALKMKTSFTSSEMGLLIQGEEIEVDKDSLFAKRITSEPRLPEVKEYVLRTSSCRPARFSAKSPQYLKAILSPNEFRLAGAFSEDITFF